MAALALMPVCWAQASAEEPTQVSLVQLLATPERFDGKRVAVVGYCWLEFEGDAVYLSREDYVNRVFKNAIWLHVSREQRVAWKSIHGKYARLEGTLRAAEQGHGSMFTAELVDLAAPLLWSDPAKPGIPPPPRRPQR